MDNSTVAKAVPEPERKSGSFGDSLKREREKRGITLDDVSLSTKIGLRMLRALEEEKFEQLPGGIFNKGFVRAYARHLGIDEEQAVAEYLEAAGETAPPIEPVVDVPPPVRDGDRSKEKEDEPGVPWGTLAIVLLVLALALSVWSYYTRESAKDAKGSPRAAVMEPQSSPAEPAGSAAASSPVTAVPLPQQPVSGNVSSQIDLAGQRSSAPNPTASTGVGSTPQSPTLSPDASTANNPPKQLAAPAVSTFVVLIEAEENSWVSITADSKTILEGTLIAPAVKAVKAQKQIVVKTGNVGGLSFAFNGRKVPAQGASGEVKALTFEATGLQSTAPKPPN